MKDANIVRTSRQLPEESRNKMQRSGRAVVDFVTETPVKLSKVCVLFTISRRTLDKWLKAGLDARVMGDKLLYTTREELQRFSRPLDFATCPVGTTSEIRDAEETARKVRERYNLRTD